MLNRADALREVLIEAPELAVLPNVTRSDVLRLAVLRGLKELEREYETGVDHGLREAAREAIAEPGEDIPAATVKRRLGL